SDAQQFPMGGRSASIGQVNAHYRPEPGIKLYTHLSDQYGPYHSTVISATASEAPHLVDGLLYHETDLEIAEHYSDTGAFTDQIFGICQLLGFGTRPASAISPTSACIRSRRPRLIPHWSRSSASPSTYARSRASGTNCCAWPRRSARER